MKHAEISKELDCSRLSSLTSLINESEKHIASSVKYVSCANMDDFGSNSERCESETTFHEFCGETAYSHGIFSRLRVLIAQAGRWYRSLLPRYIG